jgi:hypothetical protein
MQTFVTEGHDYTNQFEWITEEGRLRMLGVANDTSGLFNVTTI